MFRPDPIRPLPFIVAFVAAPLATTIPGVAVLLAAETLHANLGALLVISYFLIGALFMGGVPYLLVGIPILIYALKTEGPEAPIGKIALNSHIFSVPFVGLFLFLMVGSQAASFILFYFVLGSVFAPLWGTLFSIVYNWMLDRGRACHV